MVDERPIVTQKKNTCLTILGYGCLVLVLLMVATGVLFYFKGPEILRGLAGFGAEFGVDQMLQAMELPESERAAAMVPVREFTGQVKEGKVSTEQAMRVLEAVAKGPVSIVVMTRVFEVKHLQKSSLSEEEKKAGHIAISRFAYGTAEGKISRDKGKEIFDIVAVKKSGSDQYELKQSLTNEELKKCLGIMKDAADAAGIENKEHAIDLPSEIRKAIDKGMQAPPAPVGP